MSGISTIYDLIHTQAVTTFPSHIELVNPYFPELNDDITFESAWGLAVRSGTNTNRFVDCKLSMSRQFELVLTKKIFNGPIRTTDSVLERKTKEKLLLEDQFLFIQAIESNSTLNGSDTLGKLNFDSDSGIEFIKADRVDLMMIRTAFTIEYFENLT